MDNVQLRPTPDRVRETLFNWLAPHIRGTNCLDLFAGSGALGFEALSRGAKVVTFVEQQRDIRNALQANVTHLSANATVLAGDGSQPVATLQGPYDVVFLDPPFHQQLLAKTCAWLTEKALISESGLIYLEAEPSLDWDFIPEHWELLREKKAGQVVYKLFQNKSYVSR